MSNTMTMPSQSWGKRFLARGGRTASALALAGVVALVPAMSATAVTPEQGTTAGGDRVTIDAPGFADIAAGNKHSVGLTSDGDVWSWGDNSAGQLGDGSSVASSIVPVKVDATPWGERTITAVAAGWLHSLALASDGTVWAWGSNDSGQLGNATNVDSNVPVQVNAVPWGTLTITTIAAGSFHSEALASDGSVWTWGYNLSGQLGEGTTVNSNLPVQVNAAPWGTRTITDLALGSQHSLALASDGTVWGWGGNGSGQLGDGTSNYEYLAPVQVDGAPWGSRTITSIDASNFHSVALASDGTVWAWGSNTYGQLGDGSKTQTNLPVQVDASPWGERTINSIATGNRHAVALASDGTVWAWGDNRSDQLGHIILNDSNVPVQVDAEAWGSRVVTKISAGDKHSAAVTSDGSVWAWGSSPEGQMGNGDKLGSSVPVRSGWTVVSVTFDGRPATDIVNNGDGTLTVTTPEHVAGVVDITVAARFQNSTVGPEFVIPAGFTYATPVPAPVITTTKLADGTVSKAYSAALAATGKAPITWAVTSGKLPAGITLDKASGKLSGTPTAAGTFKFTVTASSTGKSVSKALSITVKNQGTVKPPTTNPNPPTECAKPSKTAVFADTPVAHKFYKEIDWMSCMKYSTGWKQATGKPLYKPADNLSRAAMAAFIFRMEADKSFKAPKVSPFADVQPGDKFYKEIAWMADQKLSTGYKEASGKPTYRPNDSLTREAMAAFIYRLESATDEKTKNYKAPKVSPMADMNSSMKFYKEISWMYEVKLSTGNKTAAGKEYWPKDDLSRQAMAAFIYRLVLDYRK